MRHRFCSEFRLRICHRDGHACIPESTNDSMHKVIMCWGSVRWNMQKQSSQNQVSACVLGALLCCATWQCLWYVPRLVLSQAHKQGRILRGSALQNKTIMVNSTRQNPEKHHIVKLCKRTNFTVWNKRSTT